jgi:hypothetical protein
MLQQQLQHMCTSSPQISTQVLSLLSSVYSVYWHKSTRFTGAKVQILTPEESAAAAAQQRFS